MKCLKRFPFFRIVLFIYRATAHAHIISLLNRLLASVRLNAKTYTWIRFSFIIMMLFYLFIPFFFFRFVKYYLCHLLVCMRMKRERWRNDVNNSEKKSYVKKLKQRTWRQIMRFWVCEYSGYGECEWQKVQIRMSRNHIMAEPITPRAFGPMQMKLCTYSAFRCRSNEFQSVRIESNRDSTINNWFGCRLRWIGVCK